MQRLVYALTITVLGSTATACKSSDKTAEEATILAVGDSFLDWHSEDAQSIPDVIGEQLDMATDNASVSGAMVLSNDDSAIPNQYREGNWDWVIINGGGNDITDRCACDDCTDVMGTLIAEDGSSGALRALAEQAVIDGAQVVLVGYMNLPEEAEESPQCDDELVELRARKAAMANTLSGAIFVDASQVMDGTDLDLYDTDNLHPSVLGSRAVGELIAAAMGAQASP